MLVKKKNTHKKTSCTDTGRSQPPWVRVPGFNQVLCNVNEIRKRVPLLHQFALMIPKRPQFGPSADMGERNDPTTLQQWEMFHTKIDIRWYTIRAIGAHQGRVPSVELHGFPVQESHRDLSLSILCIDSDPCARIF